MRDSEVRRASRQAYVYGSAAPARAPYAPEPEFEVVPGRRPHRDAEGLPSRVLGVVRVLVVVALIVAGLCCVRVALAAASVVTTIEAEELSDDIDAARSEGNDLEVQQSQLSNSTNIRVAAESLGMTEAVATESLTLEADVVATDADGNLSLSGSLSAMAQQD